MNKFNDETRTNLTVIASNNLNEGAFHVNRHGIEVTSSHYYSVIFVSTRWDDTKRLQLSAIEYAPWPSVYIGLNVFPEYYVGVSRIRSLARGTYIDSTLKCSTVELCLYQAFVIQISSITVDIHIVVVEYVCIMFFRIMRIENYS